MKWSRPPLASLMIAAAACAAACAAATTSVGCIDEQGYLAEQEATRRRIADEERGTDQALREGRQLLGERDELLADIARLDRDLDDVREKIRSIPQAQQDPRGGSVPASALRRLNDLEARTAQVRATTPAAGASDSAIASKQAELAAIRREYDVLYKDVEALSKLND